MSYGFIIKTPAALLGRAVLLRLSEMGRFFIFLFRAFTHIFTLPLQFSKILEQLYFIGAKSLFVICLTGLFTGMVLGLQGYYTLVKFGSEGLLGAAVALTLIRELGPVLTAIMVVGRAGSAMSAEIGIMRISEQIDALKTMDIDPVRFLVSPRIVAALISFPLLTAIFDTVGILGAYLTGSRLLGINPGIFFARVESGVVMADITGGFVKALFFAVVVTGVCCYRGYMTHTSTQGFGARGVSFSTTSAVVQSSVLVLVFDYVITSVLL